MNILTPSGYKNIMSCSIGDEVVAYDMNDGHIIYNTIEAIEEWNSDNDSEFSSSFYIVNDTYTMYKWQSVWANGNVTHVNQLKIGDVIYDDENQDITITSITPTLPQTVWHRLEISGDHSYIADGITLHNASRFWVGGTGLWNGSNTVNWSATSGGTSGASIPTATDDAYFDANSGGGTCTISAASQGGQNLSFTGVSGTSNYTGNLIQSGLGSLQVAGNITYSPSMTTTNVSVLLNGISTHTITTNGIFDSLVNYINILTISGAGTTVYGLVGKIYMATFSHIFGTFNTNDYNIYTNTFSGTIANAKFLNLGSSTIAVNATTNPYLPQNTTVNVGTSTIKYTNTSNTGITVSLGGGTYYNMWFDRGASTATITLNTTGTTTFLGSFIDTGTAAHTLQFQQLRTYNFADFRVRGSAGNLITIVSNNPGVNYAVFNKSPLGLVSCDYVAVNTINGANATTWYAGANSTLTGTAGWIATPPPPRKLGAIGVG